MRHLALLLLLTLLPSAGWAAESLTGPHVKIAWLAPESFGTETQNIGLQFQLDPHWHVYWKNPGDSGAAPKFNFGSDCAPAADSERLRCLGFELGPIRWPYPARLPLSSLVNFGYEKSVAYPFEIRPAADATKVHLQVKLEWLVCREECIPGFGTLTLDRPVQGWKTIWNAAVAKTLNEQVQKIPRTISDSGGTAAKTFPWRIASAKATDQEVRVRLIRENATNPTTVNPNVKIEAFPMNGEFLKPQAPRMSLTPEGVDFSFTRTPGAPALAQTSFVFVENGSAGELQTLIDTSQVTATTARGSATLKEQGPPLPNLPPETDASYWLLAVSAFLGGLILNLMPCVLPVLSIKFISMTRAAETNRWREALLYTAGVLVTFMALGGFFLLLRSAGTAVGWGFQLQSPLVVSTLILLFWLMALNFLGVFEWGNGVMNWAGRHHQAGSFMTGVLSVFVAAPCTGPFMGSALGAAATLPALPAMALFFFLGLGLAFPFLIMAASPAIFRKLPRPGAWMETMKQFFAFPLFATVLWLLWVLGVQTGSSGWLIAGSLLLAVSFALWCGRSSRVWLRAGAWALALIAFVSAMQAVQRASFAFASESSARSDGPGSLWIPYDPIRIEVARQSGQPVFIDFTAAWCITCQVNKKAVLETEAALEILKNHKVLLMRADWTRQDPLITQALAKLGRSSVPVYVFYATGEAAPRLLPQILRLSMIEELFKSTPEEKR